MLSLIVIFFCSFTFLKGNQISTVIFFFKYSHKTEKKKSRAKIKTNLQKKKKKEKNHCHIDLFIEKKN